ncbi:hypothetical protein L7E55_10990 [Pelotomaculum isophthalicicum JI]|uniref:Integral membrane protein, YjbE family n=1 Tax=Pelotomaculum isophthalicicum JI TaxID=947010 RepID=A0A9X4JUB7_9FIRM|nr:hypothetical protein [Pelotomaculum isophthalicicum JI]
MVWIAVKLLVEKREEEELEASINMLQAIKTIIIADLVMSLDNTLAVAAASKGNYLLLIAGLTLSIPIVTMGSQIIASLMNKFPALVYLGAGFISWTTGEMINGDKRVAPFMYHYVPENLKSLLPAVITALVIFGGWWLKNH